MSKNVVEEMCEVCAGMVSGARSFPSLGGMGGLFVFLLHALGAVKLMCLRNKCIPLTLFAYRRSSASSANIMYCIYVL